MLAPPFRGGDTDLNTEKRAFLFSEMITLISLLYTSLRAGLSSPGFSETVIGKHPDRQFDHCLVFNY